MSKWPWPLKVKTMHRGWLSFFGLEGFVDGDADGVGGFRGRDESFGGDKNFGGVEDGGLFDPDGVDDPHFLEATDERRLPVITEPAGVDGGRNEIVAESIHFEQGGQLCKIPEIVDELAAGQGWATGRLGGEEADFFAAEFIRDEGEDHTGKIAAAAGAGDQDVGFFR